MRGTADEPPVLLAGLPPSRGHRRLAFAIMALFLVVFAVTVPFAHTKLPRLEAWIPSFTATIVVTDLVTSVLLFSQFSISRQQALLALAVGYLFSALIVVAYALTFPGLFAPTGLLGAGLQSAVWLYIVWHVASPAGMIVYVLLKSTSGTTTAPQSTAGFDIALSVALAVVVVCVATWFVTAQHDLLPRIYLDRNSLSPSANVAAGVIFLSCAVALALLWFRGSSVLDLWLMVTVSAWLLEITLNGLFLTDRFSLAWYAGRTYALVAGSVVLIALLSEMTALYAHLARSVMRQRAARQARQVAMDAMAASIAHEINQPLGAIAASGSAGLRWLTKATPDIDAACAALNRIVDDSHRASAVIGSIRSMYRKDSHGRAWIGMNDLLRDTLTMAEVELRTHRVSVATELRDELPKLFGDRGQLQQVIQNLILNAIEAMATVPDRARLLRIGTDITQDSDDVVVRIEDYGIGIAEKDKEHIFEPFFTTKSAGTGIGLTICRSIIESHGGRLLVYSNHPGGTIFEVVLPIDGAVAADIGAEPRN